MLAGLLVASACSDKVLPLEQNPHVGEYVLRSINGHAPPQVIQDDESGSESILFGVVILRENDTYTDSTVVQTVTDEGVSQRSEVATGPYRLSNDTVYFTSDGSEYTMVRDGAELVQDFFGILLVYRR